MTTDDVVAKLRTELSGLSGPARAPLLTMLGQALAERYWRSGLARPEGLPLLDEAIDAIREAHGYLAPTDPLRGRVVALLGWLLGNRFTIHGMARRDREEGVAALSEALATPSVPVAFQAMCRLMLASLLLARALHALSPENTLHLGGLGMPGPATAQSTEETDRAATLLQEAIDEDVSPEITEAARSMLDVVRGVRQVLKATAGGLRTFDFGQLMNAIATLQSLVERARAAGQASTELGFRRFSFLDAAELAGLDPLRRPVAEVAEPAAVEGDIVTATVPQQVRPPATGPVDRAESRRRLHEQISALAAGTVGTAGPAGAAGATGRPTWDEAANLLDSATIPPIDAVDNLVAVASLVVESEPTPTATPEIDQGEQAIDEFLLAVSLHLRSRVDPLGAAADRRAGAEHLLAAAVRLPSRHPGIVQVLAALGAFVDGPLDGFFGPGADAYADKVDAVIAAGVVTAGADLATLHALRCLARAACDVGQAGVAALARAIGTVPLDYPWLPKLRAAAEATHR